MPAGVTSVAQWGKAMWPGVNAWFGRGYNEHPEEWPVLFDRFTDSRYQVEDVGTVGLGLAKVVGENEPFPYEGTRQGYIQRYKHVKYGLGMVVTAEAIDDDQYGVVAPRQAKTLGFSMRQTKETVLANIYNNAFTGGPTYADGVSMINASHPNISGGTWSNAGTADLSEAALEQAHIDIAAWTDDRGLKIAVMPTSLHVHPTNMFEAERILATEQRVNTANNDINAMRYQGRIPQGFYVNHYFTTAKAWFLRTNCPDGVKQFQRWPLRFEMDNSFDNNAVKYIAYERYSAGVTDARGVYGSPGT